MSRHGRREIGPPQATSPRTTTTNHHPTASQTINCALTDICDQISNTNTSSPASMRREPSRAQEAEFPIEAEGSNLPIL